MKRVSCGPAGLLLGPDHARAALRFGPALFLLVLALTGCARDEPGPRPANQRPTVRITAASVSEISGNTAVALRWVGDDADGRVGHYQYAFEVPPVWALAWLDNRADSVVAWRDTTGTEATIPLPVGQRDIYLRAVDNEGAASATDYVSIAGATVLPKTTLLEPVLPADGAPLILRDLLVAQWTGRDLDGSPAHHEPVRFEWKLTKPPVPLFSVGGQYTLDELLEGGSQPWVHPDSLVTTLISPLAPPRYYFLAVRAVDETGATERRLLLGRNVIGFYASDDAPGSRPRLTVRDRTLGTLEFPGAGDTVTVSALAGACLRFTFAADAQFYDAAITGYRWRHHIGEGAGSEAGFNSWSHINFTDTICLTRPGVESISVEARDDLARVTRGTIVIRVVAAPRDREVLYVDDFFNPGSGFADAQVDQRLIDALHAAGYPQVDTYDAWGAGDLHIVPTPPSLELLGHYRLVFWVVNGAGGGAAYARPALLLTAVCGVGPPLRWHVAAGGALWISGIRPFGALQNRSPEGGDCLASTENVAGSGFVCDYLHLCGGDFRNASTEAPRNGLLRAQPTAAAAADLLPAAEVDSSTYSFSLGGLPHYDAQFQPAFSERGGLDTLYTARTVRFQSGFNNKPIAWRYHDPGAHPTQGPVAVFSFPLQNMKVGTPGDGLTPGTHLQGLVSAMARWFRRYTPGRSFPPEHCRPEPGQGRARN